MDGESRSITSASDDSVPQVGTSVNNNFMQNEEKDATLDYLLAGEKAKTRDPETLDKAKRLSAFGETPRQIWKETGWVKGQEGKWRFELDDSKMKFRKKDGKIADVLRISELNFQYMTEGLSNAESEEFWLLRRAASSGELSAPLSDVISYNLLFEAYPALKDVLVKSDYHAVGMGKAAYDSGTKTIYLSPQANGAKLRQTLLHEIQHAVQDEEGFASGSSPDYWRERSGISAQEAERLYRNTAGEIEARDVENRADLTEEERRKTFPESAAPNDDAVFAGEETGNAFVLYHADSAESDAAGIISKLKEHLQDIARQPKVFHVKKNVLDGLGEKASEAIGNYFYSIGNKAVNPEIGVVELSKRGAKSTVFHGTSSEKLKAVGAIKDVIEKGTIFDFEKNWKNHGYDTYLIAANGTVMGQPRALGVVVKAYPGSNMNNKFYLHEVIEMELTHHLDAAADNGVTHVSKSTPIDSVSQGVTTVNSYSMQSAENDVEKTQKFSIDEDFEASYDAWAESGKPDRQIITVGKTSQALKSVGVKNQTITWDTSKINKTLKKHKYLNDGILKQIPDILENPVIVMQSKRSDSRITMFGEVYDGDGLPVMAVLELLPTNREGTVVLDEIKIASTHSRKTGNNPSSNSQTQNLINSTEILYIDPNKNRTNNWMAHNRLQLPLGQLGYGSIKSITYPEGNVNSYSMQSAENDVEKTQKFSIDESFEASYDAWVESGGNYRKTLTVGRTSDALRSIGIPDKRITWDTSKILKIKEKHNINDAIIKQVPQVIENPVIILRSVQKNSRLTMFGEVYDLNGKPVMAVLELSPVNAKGEIMLDEIKLVSAYGKDGIQSFINKSEILYIDADKKRTNSWLTQNRLQLPLGQTNYGSIKSITYPEGNVNSYSM
ncbi:LPD23 domain-containing protein, partial [Ruminococcus sp.]|uniref:MuF-C-terminal domain-containing protein n=1 Tax=Ruminococcus sp. TaxID=41978 RepID=UPI003AB608F9